mmetsp:Transcript_12794/g.19219  ORF Transcript_12794/g.19219 Transcript_12794/m.19219 type:complete len:224 (+) Transcript_12794:3-674(+)
MMHIKKKLKLQPSSVFKDDINENTNLELIDCENLDCTLQEDITDLKDKGCVFAEAGELRKALNSWHNAQQLLPHSPNETFPILNPTLRSILHELKAQAYLELDMLIQAIHEARSAVSDSPQWPEGLLTLGRCQREIGEIALSVLSYQSVVDLLGSSVHSINVEEVMSEFSEVKALANELNHRREIQLEHFSRMASQHPVSAAELEVHTCKYHLAARAKPSSLT